MINLIDSPSSSKDLQDQLQQFFSNYQPHFLDFLKSPEQINQLKDFVDKQLVSTKHISIVGLGGSSLGAKAIVEALDYEDRVSFFDNVDAHSFEKKINKLNLSENFWFFISKSGKTQEVQALLDFVIQYDPKAVSRMCLITSDNSNPLDIWAEKQSVPRFFLPEHIGGRFSIFTPVGLLPLLFLNQDINDINKGIEWVNQNSQLLVRLTAQLLTSIKSRESLHLYWIYSDALFSLGGWLQQLWMESLGKSQDKSGDSFDEISSLYMARGVSDQHSLLQEVIENKAKKLVVFMSDQRSATAGQKLMSSQGIMKHNLSGFGLGELLRVECQATKDSLSQVGINTMGLHFEEVNLKSISAFMTIYMMSTVAIADALNIDPFNQPGVESSKENTRQILSRLKA